MAIEQFLAEKTGLPLERVTRIYHALLDVPLDGSWMENSIDPIVNESGLSPQAGFDLSVSLLHTEYEMLPEMQSSQHPMIQAAEQHWRTVAERTHEPVEVVMQVDYWRLKAETPYQEWSQGRTGFQKPHDDTP